MRYLASSLLSEERCKYIEHAKCDGSACMVTARVARLARVLYE